MAQLYPGSSENSANFASYLCELCGWDSMPLPQSALRLIRRVRKGKRLWGLLDPKAISVS